MSIKRITNKKPTGSDGWVSACVLPAAMEGERGDQWEIEHVGGGRGESDSHPNSSVLAALS